MNKKLAVLLFTIGTAVLDCELDREDCYARCGI
jgi:hypothetical protein